MGEQPVQKSVAEVVAQILADASARRIPLNDGEVEQTVARYFQPNPQSIADGKASIAKRISQNWRLLGGEQKASVAIWGVGALLSAFGTVNAAQNAFTRDGEGKIHTQWSNVGIALLQATLAVGSVCAGIHTLHSATR